MLPAAEVNRLLQEAFKECASANTNPSPALLNPKEESGIYQFSQFVNKKSELLRLAGSLSGNRPMIDTIVVGLTPGDTLVISGIFFNNGPVIVLNDGVLIFDNAYATIFGDLFVLQNGTVTGTNSTLYFPQQYFYQRGILVVQHGNLEFTNCNLDYNGYAHSLGIADSGSVSWNNVHNNDFTTCGLYGHAAMMIDSTNLAGEYIISDQSTVQFRKAGTALLWHHFPTTSVIRHSFPNGTFVSNYQFDSTLANISGVGYSVSLDSCYDVMWGLMPVNGSDVEISNSTIRTAGLWFQRGDTVTVSGLVNNSYYNSFSVPLSDRILTFNNCSLQTWSLYVFDSSSVTITGCILGEVGALGRSRVISNGAFIDGSGGYFWATDTSFVLASLSTVLSTARTERNGIMIYGYSTITQGSATAIGNSIMIVAQSVMPQEPEAFEGSVAWYAFLSQPSTTYENLLVPVIGSAWIDHGPSSMLMDFGYYSLYYQKTGDTAWNIIATNVLNEVRNNTLATWNTNGLPPGSYQLKLLLADDIGNVIEVQKNVNLLPAFLNVPNPETASGLFEIFPNPVNGNSIFIEINSDQYNEAVLNISDISGKCLHACIIHSSTTTIQAPALTNGYYIARLTYPDQTQVFKKFVVNK